MNDTIEDTSPQAEARKIINSIIDRNTTGLNEDIEDLSTSVEDLTAKIDFLIKLLRNSPRTWKYQDIKADVSIRDIQNPSNEAAKSSVETKTCGVIDKVSLRKFCNAATLTTPKQSRVNDECRPGDTCEHIRRGIPPTAPPLPKQRGFCQCEGALGQV